MNLRKEYPQIFPAQPLAHGYMINIFISNSIHSRLPLENINRVLEMPPIGACEVSPRLRGAFLPGLACLLPNPPVIFGKNDSLGNLSDENTPGKRIFDKFASFSYLN